MANKMGMNKMKTLSQRIVVAVFALILMILGLAGAGVWDVSSYILSLVKLSAVVILFVEIGLLGIIKKQGKGLGFLTGVEIVVGILVALETVLMLMGTTWATLSNLSGWVLFIFGIVFAIEAFVRE